MPFSKKIVALFILAIPIASTAWTVTQDEVLDDGHQFALEKNRSA
jgi:hypothetical protein